MGIVNKILPKVLKPISRDIGFTLNTIVYKLKSIGKKRTLSPIFVLGNQKSGTSAIAALLGTLSSSTTAIDLFYSGFKYSLFIDWKTKKITTEEFISRNKVEFARRIIKEPHLSLFYTELKKEFPHAKFVMIVRNPIDNIRSILDRLNINGKKSHLDRKDKRNIFYSWNLLFSNHWLGGNKQQYIEVLSERWNIIMDSYFENQKDIILVKYENFLKDKIGILNKLSKELGLKNTDDISTLLDKAFQPKGKNSTQNPIEFFGEENLNIITRICKINMEKLGY